MAKSENKASEKGMGKHLDRGQPNSVSQIEGEHAGERGHQGGVVFKMPKDVTDHSCVRTPEHR